MVRSVPVLKTNDENGGDEILGSRTRTDRRTSPRIHSQNLLDGDLKSPPEDIVPVNSGGHPVGAKLAEVRNLNGSFQRGNIC